MYIFVYLWTCWSAFIVVNKLLSLRKQRHTTGIHTKTRRHTQGTQESGRLTLIQHSRVSLQASLILHRTTTGLRIRTDAELCVYIYTSAMLYIYAYMCVCVYILMYIHLLIVNCIWYTDAEPCWCIQYLGVCVRSHTHAHMCVCVCVWIDAETCCLRRCASFKFFENKQKIYLCNK